MRAFDAPFQNREKNPKTLAVVNMKPTRFIVFCVPEHIIGENYPFSRPPSPAKLFLQKTRPLIHRVKPHQSLF